MHTRKWIGASLGFWLLVIALGATQVQGSTVDHYRVTNGNNDGPGSLRAAIVAANGSFISATPIIEFASPGIVVTLTTPLPAITQGTWIHGNGAIIEGAATGSGLDFNGANESRVDNLTVQNCLTGFSVTGNNILLQNCNAIDNIGDGFLFNDCIGSRFFALEANGNGGYGIRVNGGQLNVVGNLYTRHNGDSGFGLFGTKQFRIGDFPEPIDDEEVRVEIGSLRRRRVPSSVRRSAVVARPGPPGTNAVTSLLNNNGGYGLELSNCVDVTIAGCYIGTDTSSTNPQPNIAGGILITDSTGTHLTHCLISGNGLSNSYIGYGLTFFGTQTPSTCLSNYVTDCYIGTDGTGTQLVPNQVIGLFVDNAAANFIGPTPTALSRTTPTPGANVIAGNGSYGVYVAGLSNHVQGNILGLDPTATLPLDNSVTGVSVYSPHNFVEGNLINSRVNSGGPFAAGVSIINADNTIVRFNRITANGTGGTGVSLSDANNCVIGGPNWGDGNLITSSVDAPYTAAIDVSHFSFVGPAINNRIHGNAMFGQILLDGARRANVPCGSTNGANLLLNHPVLTSVVTSGEGTTIQGTLNSLAATTYFVDCYASTNSNPLTPVGQCYLGATTVTTDAGCTGSFQVVVNTPAPVPAGLFITATATDPNGNTSTFSDQRVVTGTAAAADVSLTAMVTPALPEPGGSVTYSLVLSNAGPADAGPVTVADALPGAVTFVSCNATGGGVCGGSGNNRTISFSALASGASATITFVATVSSALANDTEIDNFATASLTTPDPNPANNTAVAVTFAERQADLVVTKTATPEPVDTGAMLSYSLVVSNQGPDTATGVQLIDRLPLFEGFVSASTSQGSCTQLGSVVSCSLSNLAAGASATVTVTVVPYLAGLITNTASVVAKELDPNLSNNTAMAISTVLTSAVATATITVVANPTNGGTVSGGGTAAVGSSQPISATANSGWTFTGWSDGNSQNPRTIMVPATNITYTAAFSQATQQSVATPTITPTGGTFSNSASVTLSCATAGATIHYTADGTNPTGSSPAYKKKALILTNSVMLKAVAVKGTNTSATATAAFTIIPPLPLTITTASLTDGKAKTAYGPVTLHASGGVAPYKWALATGSKLPAGLTLKASTGVISGKPTHATTPSVSLTVKVTDAKKHTDTQLFTLTVTN